MDCWTAGLLERWNAGAWYRKGKKERKERKERKKVKKERKERNGESLSP
jgi:hypothetical protein